MALDDPAKPAPAQADPSKPRRSAASTSPAPIPRGSQSPLVVKLSEWLFPLYISGLVVIFIGERVLSAMESGAWLVTLLGCALTLASAILRFKGGATQTAPRRQIERWLGYLSLLGVAGVAIYAVAQGPLAEVLGVDHFDSDAQLKLLSLVNVIWVALIWLSVVPMLFAELALRPMRRATHPEVRRVKAAAIAGAALALSCIYGSFIVYSGERVYLRADFSYFKTSTPSQSTLRLAQSLGEPVRVVAFFPDVNPVRREVARYLRDLSNEAPLLRVEFQDRLRVPKLATQLRAARDGMLVLARGDVTMPLEIGATMERARRKLKTLDRDFQEELLKVGRSARVAYVTVGHGELVEPFRAGASASGRTGMLVRELLENQNFQVKDLGVTDGLANDVPEDATVVLVLGPSLPFAAEELGALSRYAKRGGRLLLALDPDMFALHALGTEVAARPADGALAGATIPAAAPGAAPVNDPKALSHAPAALAPLAALAQLQFSPDVMVHPRQHLAIAHNESDRGRLVINTFSSHASVSTLSRNAPRQPVVVMNSGSLERMPAATSTIDFTMRTPKDSFADRNRNFRREQDFEREGIFSIAAAIRTELSQSSVPSAEAGATATTAAAGAASAEQAPTGSATPGGSAAPASSASAASTPPSSSSAAPAAAASTTPAATNAAAAEPLKENAAAEPAKENAAAEPLKENRFFVTADADAFSDVVLQNMEGNRILFLDAVRWLVGEESVSGEVNSEEDHRIEHTTHEDLVWFYAVWLGAPALVLGLGLAWGKSSRRRSEQA